VRRTALLLALCLVLAGCNAPAGGGGAGTPRQDTATPTATAEPSEVTPSATQTSEATATETTTDDAATSTPTPTPTPESPRELAATYDIAVEGGTFPANVSLVFARTAFLLDRQGVEPPQRVQIRDDRGTQIGLPTYPPFFRLLGVSPASETPSYPAYVATPEEIVVNQNLTERGTLAEATFAQEAAHVIQFREGADTTLRTAVIGARPTVEKNYLYRSVIEGAAVYAETAYQRRYLPNDTPRMEQLRQEYLNRTDVGRISFGLYYFGARYVDRRFEDPSETWAVYGNPPETTEELIHNLPPGSEPQAELRLRDGDGDDWEANPRLQTTYGELFIRGTLATSLNESVAARGAAGWGSDERQVFTNGTDDSTPGFAWAIKWDDTENATEFERVFSRYLNTTANDTTLSVAGESQRGWRTANATYRLVRVSDRTTVLFVGDPAFVRNATVTGSDGEFTVRVES
jgi:hypothetical protein